MMHIFHNGVGKPICGSVQETGDSFAPTDLSNLALWLDAADIATITETGGNVSQWNDKSGQDNHATQGTATDQPITGSYTINSLNVLRFVPYDRMFFDGSAIVGSDYTVFVVEQRSSASKGYVLDGSTSSPNRKLHFGYSSDDNIRAAHYGNDLNYYNGENSDLDARILQTDLDQSSGRALRLNGGAPVASSSSTTALISWSGSAVGGRTSGNYSGDIGEIIIYSSALTDGEKNQVGSYLAEKWGISWSNI